MSHDEFDAAVASVKEKHRPSPERLGAAARPEGEPVVSRGRLAEADARAVDLAHGVCPDCRGHAHDGPCLAALRREIAHLRHENTRWHRRAQQAEAELLKDRSADGWSMGRRFANIAARHYKDLAQQLQDRLDALLGAAPPDAPVGPRLQRLRELADEIAVYGSITTDPPFRLWTHVSARFVREVAAELGRASAELQELRALNAQLFEACKGQVAREAR
jgi:hypothetical protein